MGIDPGSIAAGAVIGGIATDALEKAKHKAADVTGNPTIQHGTIEDQMLVEMVSRIEHALRKEKDAHCDPKWMEAYIFNAQQNSGMQPLQYKRFGYKHVSLATPSAFTLVVGFPIGPISFAMNAGLNACDFPDNLLMWATAAGPGPNGAWPVMFYYGDDQLDIPGV